MFTYANATTPAVDASCAQGVALPESRFDEKRTDGLLQALRSTAAGLADAAAAAAAASKLRSHLRTAAG